MMQLIIDLFLNGLIIGLIYALVALGYTMVYGIIRLINFAHGDIFMIGSYVGYFAFVILGYFSVSFGWLGLIFVFITAIIASGLVGVLVELLAYKPLLKSKKIILLITSFGVSFTLENIIRVAFGPTFLAFPNNFGREIINIGILRISYIQIAILLICSLLMIGITLFVKKTMLGKAMRAIALNFDSARLMGINVDKVVTQTFFIGASLAGAGGVMYGLYYGQINFMMGFTLGLKAFISSIIGGIGNIPGAFLGGILLGSLETFSVGFIGGKWKDVVSFCVLIFVLIFKPTGILGEKTAERM